MFYRNNRYMKPLAILVLLALCVGAVISCFAQTLNFTNTQRMTNRELLLRLNLPGAVRIDASTNLPNWLPLVRLNSTGLNYYVDRDATFLHQRLYRAQQLSATPLAEDWLATTNGDVLIRPIRHASFLLRWNGLAIYNDPDSPTTLYTGLPKADLILVGHEHGDHFDQTALNALTNVNCAIVAPQAVYNLMAAPLQARTTVLGNGMSTNLLGMLIEAVPAYNTNHMNHPLGRGNGYILNIGGRRLYMAGDTGPSPEMRALPNIDVAFVPMNLQFTMSTTQAVAVVRAMRPKVIYPYHYSGNPVADLNWFKQQLSDDLGIEVRVRNWY